MMKNFFHTRFNVAPSKNADKIYDSRDNVDRLSYVDSTLMINRLINEGRNLNEYRAKALRAGQYSGDMTEIDSDQGIPCPVFVQDPTVSMPIIEEAQSKLKSSIESAAAERSGNGSTNNTDLDKTEKALGSHGVEGVASAEKVEG